MNITKVNGSYSKELFENLDTIKYIYEDGTKSVTYMKNAVKDIIAPAWMNARAKPRFIGYLNDCGTKREIYNLCWNTIQKAMKYKPSRTY